MMLKTICYDAYGHQRCMSIPEPTSIEFVPFIANNLLCIFVTDGPDYQSLLGSLDCAYLFAYAIGMFVRSEQVVAYTFIVHS